MDLGAFTKERLAEASISQIADTMLKQALEVHDFTLKHNSIHAARWQELQVGLANKPCRIYRLALDALEDWSRAGGRSTSGCSTSGTALQIDREIAVEFSIWPEHAARSQ